MSSLIFIFISFLYLLLGFYFIKNKTKSLFYFLLSVIILPYSTYFDNYFYKSGIYCFEFYYFGIFVYFLRKTILKNRIPKFLLITIFITLIFFLFTINSEFSIIYIFKDLKPFLIFTIIILISNLKEEIFIKKYNLKFYMYIINFKYVLFYMLLNYFNFVTIISNDIEWTIEVSSYRYADISLIFVVLYFIYKLITSRINISIIILTILPILISGNRTIIFVLILLSVLFILNNKKFIYKVFFTVFTISISIFVLENIGGRFAEILEFENISKLLAIRFSPFILEFNSFDFHNYFLGKGFGNPFYIPWFEYRENIDNYNPNIDNLYLTYYTKIGIFTFLIFYGVHYGLKSFLIDRKYVRYIYIYFLIMSITVAFTYQSTFIFLYLFSYFILKNYKIDKILLNKTKITSSS